MWQGFRYLTVLAVLCVFAVPVVSAGELSADYLYGRWSVNDKVCNASSSEFITFNSDGTFNGVRDGKTEITGFWNLRGDVVELDLLSSLASFQDLNDNLGKYKGLYSYAEGQMLIFNAKKNGFEAFSVFGDMVKRATAVKCP